MGRSPAAGDTDQMLAQLKRLFKAAGLKYKEVGEAIGVSEKSMKRYMNGGALTLAILEQLCGVVGISIMDLVELAIREREEVRYMREEQEEILGRDLLTGMIFSLLQRGWTAVEIQRALELSDDEIDKILLNLNGFGVLNLFPGRRVKIIVKTKTHPRTPRRKGLSRIRKAWQRVVQDVNLDDPHTLWRVGMAWLPRHKIPEVAELYDRFLEQVYALEDRQNLMGGEVRQWYRIPMCATPSSSATLKYDLAST